jgi:hypothetical protein
VTSHASDPAPSAAATPPRCIGWIDIADEPDVWRAAGFDVSSDGACVVGGVELRLLGANDESPGMLGWTLVADHALPDSIDGIATSTITEHVQLPDGDHTNGVFRIDHLVVGSSSTPRTVNAFASAGLERRGHRDTNSEGTAVDMTFFWVGDQLVELAGPPRVVRYRRPARFSGIAFSCIDIDALAAQLGEKSTEPRDAVQPGRRICALRREAGASVPIAFMTPHVRSS